MSNTETIKKSKDSKHHSKRPKAHKKSFAKSSAPAPKKKSSAEKAAPISRQKRSAKSEGKAHSKPMRRPASHKPIIPKSPLRIIMLGGLNEIGKNITVFEYENDIIVLESLTLDEIKTSKIAQILANLGVTEKALIVLPENDKNVVLSARNLRGVDTTFVGAINTYEVLGHTKCIITKDAVSKLEEVYA